MSDLTLQERYDFQVDANRSLVIACGKSEDENAKLRAEIERLLAVLAEIAAHDDQFSSVEQARAMRDAARRALEGK